MTFIIIVLLVLGLCVALGIGLLRVLRDLVDNNAQESPIFQDLNTMFQDPAAEHREVRSQFAWQSRSHFRAPD